MLWKIKNVQPDSTDKCNFKSKNLMFFEKNYLQNFEKRIQYVALFLSIFKISEFKITVINVFGVLNPITLLTFFKNVRNVLNHSNGEGGTAVGCIIVD